MSWSIKQRKKGKRKKRKKEKKFIFKAWMVHGWEMA
jgi:hypothetical protein